jgi:quinol monooxygenase YgiN
MSAPIVFISRFRLAEGKRDESTAAFAQFVDMIGVSKPRTALYAAYLDEPGSEVCIVHVFPDAAAMASHFEGSDERSSSVAGLIMPAGFEVYGAAPPAAIEQLRHEADASGIDLVVHPEPIGGFLRAPV